MAIPAHLGTMLLADGRLPTGGYAHSGGLEQAVVAGLQAHQVPDFIAGRLRTVAVVDATAAVLALRAARTDPDGLAEVQSALLARMPSEPLRAASQLLGRGLARLARHLWADTPAVAALDRLDGAPLRPVALGVVAAALGMGEEQAALSSAYDDAQTVAAAALKLLPVDPSDTTRWLLAQSAELERLVATAVGVGSVQGMPATAAPQVEEWSLDHSGTARRIFVA